MTINYDLMSHNQKNYHRSRKIPRQYIMLQN